MEIKKIVTVRKQGQSYGFSVGKVLVKLGEQYAVEKNSNGQIILTPLALIEVAK